ncbi:MAG: 3-methyl-2-oxobutanoate dehydrogenase subunit VorB [Candidatus Omnitrophica bacterium]|nr:3-methyl-2-oxobutanoate dehydrogenase subunit VorB [Candidatus Omnitrophota bacterium]HOX54715.1 3-methyl-2-oxobutanoate dehydrogenase subunit VorB [Candidatus Omnitrophota bacterium]
MIKEAKKILITGNEAIAEAAIQAGCRFYAGYPITPQNEVPAYMSLRMPEVGGVFIQAESELAAINMVLGAASAGARAMTSSSSPGISLKQEGISYLAGCQLPAVIVNIMRGGPGLGNIAPAQSDYFQATKGGGHGDYRCIVLAPSTVQEAADLTALAFDLADKYRNPVIILGDGMLGQMMEPISGFKPQIPKSQSKTWTLTGAKNREPHIIRSLFLGEGVLEDWNKTLQAKYKKIEATERRYESFHLNDSEIILVAYGTMARIAKEAMNEARAKGIKAGLIRPISLWPFPVEPFIESSDKAKNFLVVEMSAGQMVEDVRLAVNGKAKVDFYGRTAGGIPTKEEILQQIKLINK